MAEELKISKNVSKEGMYRELYPQLCALLEGELDSVANLGNFCAVLHEVFGWLWVGFYRVCDQQLVLGPFQGPLACTRIAYGKGVCGTAWAEKKVQIVPDVNQFPGHIACSSASRSEIVLPISDRNGKIVGVLDIDSADYGTFDLIDAQYLKQLLSLIDTDLPFWQGGLC
ncbi:MAG: GAF domain-containing protein [Verrucomicrobia bacterium]|nr:GAF domain-containing protein [Verrucomicrobiota bacterium]